MPFGDSILLQTGECDNRPKRAVMQQDDTVDDQDAIPAFNPTVTSVSLTLTWPTASGITKENVTQFCENKLRYSKAGAACGQLNGVDVDGLVQQCITDIQVQYFCPIFRRIIFVPFHIRRNNSFFRQTISVDHCFFIVMINQPQTCPCRLVATPSFLL